MHKLDNPARQVAVALATALIAGLAIAGCKTTGNPIDGPTILDSAGTPVAVGQPGAEGTPGPLVTPTKRVIRPTEFVCDSPEIAALGLGLRVMQTKADAEKLLRGVMPWPKPGTLPPDMRFLQGLINSAMNGKFKQSTLSLVWSRGEYEFAIHYMNAYPPIEEPPKEPHKIVTIRDGRQAYQFEPPFMEGLHTILWRDKCRYIAVGGLATEEEVLEVAENLILPEDTPPDATLGDMPDFLPPDQALPTARFPKDSTAVPGMTGTPVFGPDKPGILLGTPSASDG